MHLFLQKAKKPKNGGVFYRKSRVEGVNTSRKCKDRCSLETRRQTE